MAQHIQIFLYVIEDANKAYLLESFHWGQVTEVPGFVTSFFLKHSKVAGLYSNCSSCLNDSKDPNKTAFYSSTRRICLSPAFQFFILIFCNVALDSKNVYKTRSFCSFYSPKQIGKKETIMTLNLLLNIPFTNNLFPNTGFPYMV